MFQENVTLLKVNMTEAFAAEAMAAVLRFRISRVSIGVAVLTTRLNADSGQQ